MNGAAPIPIETGSKHNPNSIIRIFFTPNGFNARIAFREAEKKRKAKWYQENKEYCDAKTYLRRQMLKD